jgi:hypothetical protein
MIGRALHESSPIAIRAAAWYFRYDHHTNWIDGGYRHMMYNHLARGVPAPVGGAGQGLPA